MQMKNVILFCLAFTLSSCTKEDKCYPGGEPAAPYGTPDDVSRYEGTDGYRSVDYTYYCYGGKYVSVSFVRKDACSDYEKYSEYTSGGICGYSEIVQRLTPLNSRRKILYLMNAGYKFQLQTFMTNKSPSYGVLIP